MQTRIPAAAARADPMTKVKEMILSVLMPTSEAVSWEWETALMARPNFVFNTMNSKRIMRIKEVKKTVTCWFVTATWPNWNKATLGMISGKTLGVAPKTTWPRFSRRRESPTAVMSKFNFGAPRRGRYAKRSIRNPRRAEASMAAMRTSKKVSRLGFSGACRAKAAKSPA